MAAYIVLAVGFHVAMLETTFLMRALGHDPRSDALGSVHNLRRVDGRVWAGAQPDAEEYRQLAAHGVRLVIDLRTGASDDPYEHDPALLASLGVERLVVPVPDGHAPSPAAIRRLAGAIDDADGLVYLHCGGGVGRSASAQAALLAASGMAVPWSELFALGPMSLEQAWFVLTAARGDARQPNPVIRRLSEVLDAPRRTASRLRGWLA